MTGLSNTLPKIVVCTNSLTAAQYPAYANHNQFWFKLGQEFGHKYQFIKVNPPRMSIDRCRNLAAETAIKYDCDYILWLDDDVLVPMDGFGKLLDACISGGAQCAAANVIIRGYPFDYMIFRYEKEWRKSNLVPVKSISRTDVPDEIVEEVGAVGFSFCLIEVASLKRLEKPYFITAPNHTEDVYYCIRLVQLLGDKAKIVVDWSVECNHLLWEEPISHTNRLAYKTYFETMNPEVLLSEKKPDTMDGDKPKEYTEALLDVMKHDAENVKVDNL